jgi:hypothetical protein
LRNADFSGHAISNTCDHSADHQFLLAAR